jgi:competence ComEA-like helix-hairpin-helix protein
MIHLTLQEKKVLIFLSVLFLAGIVFGYWKKTCGCNVCLIDVYTNKAKPQPVDINTASREQLIALPGIGPKIADSIIARRVSDGPIGDINDLKKIKGITDATLAHFKDYVYVR